MLFFSILIDVLLVGLFVFFTIWFSKYGFIRTVYKIGKAWLSLFTSFAIGPFVSGRIRDWFLSSSITNGINSTLTNIVENNPNGYSIGELFANLPNGFVSFLAHNNISLPDLEAIYGSSTEASGDILYAIAERIAVPTADMIASISGYLLGFIIPFVFFKWLDAHIWRQKKVPFYRYVDIVFGSIVGIVIGVASAVALSTLIFTVFQIVMAFNAESVVMQIYTDSFVFEFINKLDVWGMVTGMFS